MRYLKQSVVQMSWERSGHRLLLELQDLTSSAKRATDDCQVSAWRLQVEIKAILSWDVCEVEGFGGDIFWLGNGCFWKWSSF